MFIFFRTNDKRGYSLVELMMGLGIFSVLIMVILFILNFFWAKSIGLQSQVSNRLDQAVVEKFLFQDLLNAFPSMGNLKTPSDVGGIGFFDIYATTPLNRITPPLQTRQLTLDATKGGGSVEFIVEMPKGDPGLSYQQSRHFYYQPSDAYQGPPLSFVGLDQKGFFSRNFPTLAKQQSHFYFYSPATITVSCGNIFCNTRFYSILLMANGARFDVDNMNGNFDLTHPLYPNQSINSIDQWLRWLPPIGGAMSTVMVVPANVIRYRIDNQGRLYRAIKSGLTYQNETLIGTQINQVIFQRPDVTTPLVQFKLNLVR